MTATPPREGVAAEDETFEWIEANDIGDPTPAPPTAAEEHCTLGVGCDETGICYADAHDQPEQCGRTAAPAMHRIAELCDITLSPKEPS